MLRVHWEMSSSSSSSSSTPSSHSSVRDSDAIEDHIRVTCIGDGVTQREITVQLGEKTKTERDRQKDRLKEHYRGEKRRKTDKGTDKRNIIVERERETSQTKRASTCPLAKRKKKETKESNREGPAQADARRLLRLDPKTAKLSQHHDGMRAGIWGLKDARRGWCLRRVVASLKEEEFSRLSIFLSRKYSIFWAKYRQKKNKTMESSHLKDDSEIGLYEPERICRFMSGS